jgi:hypothetical protein
MVKKLGEMVHVKDYISDAAKATLLISILVCIFKLLSSGGGMSLQEGALAKNLVLEAKQWLDLSSGGGNVHSLESVSYARCSLNTARTLLKDSLLEQVSGIDIHQLDSSISKQQKSARARIKN